MKSIFFFFLLVACTSAGAQSPAQFIGHWEGELKWFKGNSKEPRTYKMQLKVFPSDTAGQFTWKLIYGEDNKDQRPYIIKPVDTATGHWVIDEKNSIFIDQFFVGDRLCGTFVVGDNRINNCYWLQEGDLIVEFLTTSVEPVNTTGGTSEEIPKVESYTVNGYQRAILKRRK